MSNLRPRTRDLLGKKELPAEDGVEALDVDDDGPEAAAETLTSIPSPQPGRGLVDENETSRSSDRACSATRGSA